MNTTDKVFYSAFGAKGDGETNDFLAIKAAHAYANEHNLPVFSDEGATYYIGKTGGDTVIVMTDTDWTGAKFIFDDRDIVAEDPDRSAHIFTIASSYKPVTLTPDSPGKAGETIRKINESAKNNGGIALAYGDHPTIDLGLGYPAMLSVHDDENRQYIRYGGNKNNGYFQREIIVVDENGICAKDTGILHDFSKVTSIVATRIDDAPVTIKGGEVTTRANQCPPAYKYFNRGFLFKRSNAVMDGLTHYITDEGDQGNPYHGFIRAQETYNVTIQNCNISGHRVYYAMGTGWVTPQGSYDITAWDSCNITWKNLRQINFFHLDENGNPTDTLSTVRNSEDWYCWGIMSSNYCKNLTYDNCKVTRFDAHCGTYNATIKDSEVAVVAMIGGGKLEITNSIVYDTFKSVVCLRDDYGATFAGDFVLKDVTFKITKSDTVCDGCVNVIEGTYTNHNFGYTTYLPQNILIDNFKVDAPVEVTDISLLKMRMRHEGAFDEPMLTPEVVNDNPMVMTKNIIIKNNEKEYNYIHPVNSHPSFGKINLVVEE